MYVNFLYFNNIQNHITAATLPAASAIDYNHLVYCSDTQNNINDNIATALTQCSRKSTRIYSLRILQPLLNKSTAILLRH